MRNGFLSKSLTIGIITLFIGVSNFPILHAQNLQSEANTQTNVIIVDDEGDGDFTTINNAVRAAKIGDTIEVYSGIYYENVIVDKQLILKGIAKELGTGDDIGKPTIDSEGFGSLESSNSSIKLKADRCIVENFTVINSGAFYGAGIKIYSAYNIIQNNLVSNNWYGINPIEESSFNFISNNEIKDNECFGVKYSGLVDDLCSDNNISNNEISGSGIGVSVAPRDIVYNNTIFKNRVGINFESENAQAMKNTIYENEIGVFLHENNLVVKNNNIRNNNVGVEMVYCIGSIVSCNNLTNNDLGIRFQNGKNGKYCSITFNNFFNNTLQANFIYYARLRYTNWNSNYWSDWKTTSPRPIEGKIVINRWPNIHREYSWIQYDRFPSKDPIDGTTSG